MAKRLATAVMILGGSLIISLNLAPAQYPDPEEVKNITDLLNPGAGVSQAKRACIIQIDGTSVPCGLVWYIEFKDDRRAIQFNRGTENKPMISFSGTQRKAGTILVDRVLFRIGDRASVVDEKETDGLCLIGKIAMGCQARISDGRLLIGSIFVSGR